MLIDIVTIFPGMFRPVLDTSILKIAREKGAVEVRLRDLRDFTDDRHCSVDDRPFGGGPGMILKVGPVVKAVRAIEAEGPAPVSAARAEPDLPAAPVSAARAEPDLPAAPVSAARAEPDLPAAPVRILMTPQGERFTQALADELARRERLLLIAGHYEGYDERIRTILAPREISIGDYVLTGGELAAMVVVDAVVRLLPGVLGAEDATEFESFSSGSGGMLEYPQYTRPPEFEGLSVPEVLLSGDHARVDEWRRAQAARRTRRRRPDLLEGGRRKDEG